jgi:large subunit ribosomal protein L7e
MVKLGLKEVNNAVFLLSDPDTVKSLLQVQNYISYGYPSRDTVNNLIRKRGYLKKDEKRLAITDNNLVEDVLGEQGIICVEDIIESLLKCHKPDSHFEELKKAIWPLQLRPQQESIDEKLVKHSATGSDLRKTTTKVEKGGHLGLMGTKINAFVLPMI